MSNPNDSADNEEQLVTPPNDYRSLLEATRPLIIDRSTAMPSRLSTCRDQGVMIEAEDCYRESVLKSGEIIYPDLSKEGVTNSEVPATTAALSWTTSNLRIRIYIGLS
jgi:hypothetical protein